MVRRGCELHSVDQSWLAIDKYDVANYLWKMWRELKIRGLQSFISIVMFIRVSYSSPPTRNTISQMFVSLAHRNACAEKSQRCLLSNFLHTRTYPSLMKSILDMSLGPTDICKAFVWIKQTTL